MLVGTKPREMSGKVFKSDPDRAFGRESRSLKACYELYEVSLLDTDFVPLIMLGIILPALFSNK